MAKYKKLSHTVYYCVYHIVWTPKYRYRVLESIIADYLEDKIKSICDWKGVEVIELNIQKDHIHMVCSIPPKLSISDFMGILKGKTAILMFQKWPILRKKQFWGNHFWSRGYFVNTVGIDEEKIRRYVKYQEEEDKKQEGDSKDFSLF